ncbi:MULTISPECIES: rod-binding protein [Cedecea]|jgi:flagellar protein FlgJ|uniref:Peptidoglycan hydrolase n=1 Tax=Cedecea neteri TaxID=158822 RepID=A0A089Q1F0_9ENTR|nr:MULTISPECIES: rod-binding protein [Cedecea]AIR04334.1 peptidoglycan hydrolase [Cedecea neteri]NWC65512.1 rod-binding protein [Cedecea sp. P7760]
MINPINRQQTVLPGDMTGQVKPQNVEQAAEQFEAMFLRSMMQQMRKASDAMAAEDSPFNSKQQRMMRDFYDDRLASELASQRSTGIAGMIIAQLVPAGVKAEAKSAALPQQPSELATPVIPVMRRGQES